MTRTADLLRRLSKEGIEVPQHIRKAMLQVDLEDFTDYDVSPFYADIPVPYIESNSVNIKTRRINLHRFFRMGQRIQI